MGSFVPVTDVGRSPPPGSKSIVAIYHQFDATPDNSQSRRSSYLVQFVIFVLGYAGIFQLLKSRVVAF